MFDQLDMFDTASSRQAGDRQISTRQIATAVAAQAGLGKRQAEKAFGNLAYRDDRTIKKYAAGMPEPIWPQYANPTSEIKATSLWGNPTGPCGRPRGPWGTLGPWCIPMTV